MVSRAARALLLLALAVVSPQLRGEIRLLGVTTTAGFVPGLPGPGSPATLFVTGVSVAGPLGAIGGVLRTEIHGITLTYGDSYSAPLYMVADLGTYQIVNFQIPWENHSGPLVLSQGSNSVVIPVDAAPWGEFFTTADGNAVALHAVDYSLITAQKPAAAGEWIVLYASNLGAVQGPPATGSSAPLDRLIPLDPVTAFPWNFKAWLRNPVGDQLLTTNFFGLAPGFVGVYQVNVKLPDALPAGNLQLYLQRSRDCGFFFTPGCGRGIVMDTSVTAIVP